MKKIIFTSFLAIMTLALGGCGYAPSNQTNTPSTVAPVVTTVTPENTYATPTPISSATPEVTPIAVPTPAPTPAVVNQTSSVSIHSFSFNPAALTIKQGTTVVWTNDDPVPHQIKSASFNSSLLNTGDNFSYTFENVGTFDYSCAIHPTMTGTITVQ